ncbi:MAG: hypothetical protein ABFC96_02060 [Thermoguttaceae bacterium]
MQYSRQKTVACLAFAIGTAVFCALDRAWPPFWFATAVATGCLVQLLAGELCDRSAIRASSLPYDLSLLAMCFFMATYMAAQRSWALFAGMTAIAVSLVVKLVLQTGQDVSKRKTPDGEDRSPKS